MGFHVCFQITRDRELLIAFHTAKRLETFVDEKGLIFVFVFYLKEITKAD